MSTVPLKNIHLETSPVFVPAVLVSSFFSAVSTDSSVSAVLLQKKEKKTQKICECNWASVEQ